MEATPKPPLPWEHKAAIGCLVIVALQEIRELLLLTLGHPGLMNLGPLSPLLLVVTMTVGVSVRSRRGSTWWWGGALLGSVGLFLVAAYWEAVRAGLGIGNPLQRISTVTEYEWIKGP